MLARTISVTRPVQTLSCARGISHLAASVEELLSKTSMAIMQVRDACVLVVYPRNRRAAIHQSYFTPNGFLLWSVVQIPGAGRGLVSAQKIARGEVVHREAPMLCYPALAHRGKVRH